MKINPVLLFIALVIVALAAFGFYTGNSDEANRLIFTAGAGLSLFITLAGLLALSLPNGGTGNIRAVSVVFFIVFLAEHIIFSFTGVRFAPYVIITGIALVLYVLICYVVTAALK